MTRAIGLSLVYLAALAAALFLPAGRLDWPAAWIFLAVAAGFVAAAFALLPRELLAARSRPGDDVERADVVLASAGAIFLYPAPLIVAGFEAGRAASAPAPVAQAAGLALFVAGYGFALWAMRTNRFFETFVRIQEERGHEVVSSGPYALVRHPGYLGALVAHIGIPLALGSWWAFLPVALGALLFAVRARREDETLATGLRGYASYRKRVRWRLLPLIWLSG